MTPLKVLVFTTLFPNAAAPQHGIFVAERLRQLLRDGDISARVIAPVPWFPFGHPTFGSYGRFARAPRAELHCGVPIAHPRYPVVPKVGMRVAPHLLAWGARRALDAVRAAGFDFDVIDAHYLFPDGVAAAELAARCRRPFVLTARGTDVNVIARMPWPGRAILRAIRQAAATVTVSESLRTELERLGADGSTITVLRNGIDLDRFRPLDRDQARSRLGWRGRRLLVVARLVPGKGHTLALAALVALPGDTQLSLVGDGPLRGSLTREARRLGIADRVEFLGNRDHAELPAIYSAADALMLTSEREGMPNVLLESLACGTPVIAGDVGGVGEIVDAPDAGFIVRDRSPEAFAAACHRLFTAPPPPARVRAHAEKFGWREVSARQAALLRRAAGIAS